MQPWSPHLPESDGFSTLYSGMKFITSIRRYLFPITGRLYHGGILVCSGRPWTVAAQFHTWTSHHVASPLNHLVTKAHGSRMLSTRKLLAYSWRKFKCGYGDQWNRTWNWMEFDDPPTCGIIFAEPWISVICSRNAICTILLTKISDRLRSR